MTLGKIEGHYRLISHDEHGVAFYARLDAAAGPEWVRGWRDATTFLTRQSAEVAREAAQLDDAPGLVDIAERFHAWQLPRPKRSRPTRGRRAS